MKILFRASVTLGLWLVTSGYAIAQTADCVLKTEQLPEVRGFKLGLTPEQIATRHPGFKVSAPDANGYVKLSYPVAKFLSVGEDSLIREEDRKGLDRIEAGFLDNKLIQIRFTYDDSTIWEHPEDFFTAIVASLKLPIPQAWTRINDHIWQIKCDGNSIEIVTRSNLSGGSVAFAQHGFQEVITERERAAKERQRKAFKP